MKEFNEDDYNSETQELQPSIRPSNLRSNFSGSYISSKTPIRPTTSNRPLSENTNPFFQFLVQKRVKIENTNQKRLLFFDLCSLFVFLALSLFFFFFGGFFYTESKLGVSLINVSGSGTQLENYEIPRLDFSYFNTELDSSLIQIPFKTYITKKQRMGQCVTSKVSCDTSKDCMISLPNLQVVKPGICRKFSTNPEMKGCVVKTWCPEENIYSKHTKTIHLKEFNQTKIQIHSFVDYKGDSYSNGDKEVEYPGKHANSIHLKEFIKTVGYSGRSLRNVGGVIKISTRFSCISYPFLSKKCNHKTKIEPVNYFGESIGYSWESLMPSFPNFEKRTLQQNVGLSFYSFSYGEFTTFHCADFVWYLLTLFGIIKMFMMLYSSMRISEVRKHVPIDSIVTELVELKVD